jgi:hypothetical protein
LIHQWVSKNEARVLNLSILSLSNTFSQNKEEKGKKKVKEGIKMLNLLRGSRNISSAPGFGLFSSFTPPSMDSYVSPRGKKEPKPLFI